MIPSPPNPSEKGSKNTEKRNDVSLLKYTKNRCCHSFMYLVYVRISFDNLLINYGYIYGPFKVVYAEKQINRAYALLESSRYYLPRIIIIFLK